jgi:hypothetical protein
MADKPDIDVFNNHLWGISNDEYIGQEWCFYDGENVDIRKNSKEISLSGYMTYYYATNWEPKSHYWNNTFNITASSVWANEWYLNGYLNGLLYKNKSTTTGSSKYQNLVYYGNKLLLLTDKFIHTIAYDSTNITWLGIWGTQVLWALSWWTGWAWWSYSASPVWRTHTFGSWTNTLTDTTSTIAASTYYAIRITHSTIVWTATITMGWVTFGTIDSSATTYTFFNTTSGINQLVITPDNAYNWTITDVLVYPVTWVVEEQWTFNNNVSNRPWVKTNIWLFLWDWNKVVRINWDWTNYAPASWALTDVVLTLPAWEELIGMYELWDQIVMFSKTSQYFWDWVNKEVDRIVPWDQPIIATTQFKTIFYVLTKDAFTILWKTSTGYDRQEVQKEEVSTSTPPTTRRGINTVTNNSLIMKDWIAYFSWYPKWYVNTYGYFYPSFPESFNKIKLSITGSVTSLYGGSLWSIVCWYVNSVWNYGVMYVDTKKFSVTNKYPITPSYNGIIYYNPILWQDWGTNKALEKYRVSYTVSQYNRIPVYAKIDDETDKFSFYVWTVTSVPVIWDVYTAWSNTYMIERIYKDSVNNYWLSTKRTAWTTAVTDTWTLTRTTTPSTWPATMAWTYFYNIRMIWLIDGSDTEYSNKYRYSIVYAEKYNKLQAILWLVTYNSETSPRVGSFISVSRQIENDL